MLPNHFDVIERWIGRSNVLQITQANQSTNKQLSSLLNSRQLPDEGWEELSIQLMLNELATFDSNNFIGSVGVGEREGRVYSKLVSRRHFNLTHGVGRSGDIMELQPKAVGSSLMNVITHSIMLDAIRNSFGLMAINKCCILPMATGMSLTMCMLSIRRLRPAAKYVLWSRIDQKSCFKSILTAGFEPIIVELQRTGDQLQTDVNEIERCINEIGDSNVLCVLSTTSTFAPRVPDDVENLSTICAQHNIPHIINNAYGLQCFKCCHMIENACRVGRVDYVVQSVDKNLLVPVGGAVVCSPSVEAIQRLSESYAGRASASSVMDVFITLLEMGRRGLKELRRNRKELSCWFKEELQKTVETFGCRVLETPSNKISYAIDISDLMYTKGLSPTALSQLGSQLFTRRCTGARVILSSPHASSKRIASYEFKCYGSHSNSYPSSYMTVACAIGVNKEELETFICRLKRVLQEL